MKTIRLFAALLLVMAMGACGFKSDPDVMQRLDGTWVTTETEYEDGVKMTTKEVTTFYAEDATFKQNITIRISMLGESMNLGSFTINGMYRANEDAVYLDWDDNDVEVDLDSDFLDEYGGKRGFLKELSESKGELEIVKLTSDEFVIKDVEGDKTEYSRQ